MNCCFNLETGSLRDYQFMSYLTTQCDYIRFSNSIEMEQLVPLPLVVVKIQPRGNKQNPFNVVRCIISTQPQLTLVLTSQIEHILTCLGGLKKRP